MADCIDFGTTAGARDFTNFLDRPTDGETLQIDRHRPGGGRLPQEDPARARGLAAALARAQFGFAGSIRGQPTDRANAAIPAGYTYLLQLVAHDMVDTAAPLWAPSGTPGLNRRGRRLMLDTLYGAGPEGPPGLFVGDGSGAVLPTRFAIGALRQDDAMLTCPMRDVPRQSRPGEEEIRPRSFPCPVIGDARNDRHGLISQLAVVFMLLHNTIHNVAATLPGLGGARTASRRFEVARAAVTVIFRQIVRNELLPKLLCHDVQRHYDQPGARCIDRAFARDHDAALPVEFAHGAFRLGHAMLRSSYSLNELPILNGQGHPTLAEILMQTSARDPRHAGLGGSWAVTWSRFFPVPGITDGTLNLSHVLAPGMQMSLFRPGLFTPPIDLEVEGLALRDLLSALWSRSWSVPALVARIRADAPGRDLIGPCHNLVTGAWREEMGRYLAARGMAGEDVAAVVADPPLPFFIPFEAAWQTQGASLGTLGSILVGDVLHAVLQQGPHAVRNCDGIARLLDDCRPGLAHALAAVARRLPETMGDVILIVQAAHVFATAQPRFA